MSLEINGSYRQLFKELSGVLTRLWLGTFANRLVRTRLLGGVGAGGEKPPATQFVAHSFAPLIHRCTDGAKMFTGVEKAPSGLG